VVRTNKAEDSFNKEMNDEKNMM